MLRKIFRGQSLFEVIFAVAIAALVLIAIVTLSTRSIKTADFSTNNAQATKYAQEAMEWVRMQRDTLTWATFSTYVTGIDIDLGTLAWGAGNHIIPSNSNFIRHINLSWADPNKIIRATVKVTWTDSDGTHEVRNESKFTNWNR